MTRPDPTRSLRQLEAAEARRIARIAQRENKHLARARNLADLRDIGAHTEHRHRIRERWTPREVLTALLLGHRPTPKQLRIAARWVASRAKDAKVEAEREGTDTSEVRIARQRASGGVSGGGKGNGRA